MRTFWAHSVLPNSYCDYVLVEQEPSKRTVFFHTGPQILTFPYVIYIFKYTTAFSGINGHQISKKQILLSNTPATLKFNYFTYKFKKPYYTVPLCNMNNDGDFCGGKTFPSQGNTLKSLTDEAIHSFWNTEFGGYTEEQDFIIKYKKPIKYFYIKHIRNLDWKLV